MAKRDDRQSDPAADSRLRIVAASDYLPKANPGYARDILGMVVSAVLIIGGATGKMVLRGTDSSTALMVAGFLFLTWDIIALIRRRANNKQLDERRLALDGRRGEKERAVQRDGRTLDREVHVRIDCQKQLAAMDFAPRLNGGAMTRDVKAHSYGGSTGRVRGILTFDALDLIVAFDVTDPQTTELVFELTRDRDGIGLVLPDAVRFVPNMDT